MPRKKSSKARSAAPKKTEREIEKVYHKGKLVKVKVHPQKRIEETKVPKLEQKVEEAKEIKAEEPKKGFDVSHIVNETKKLTFRILKKTKGIVNSILKKPEPEEKKPEVVPEVTVTEEEEKPKKRPGRPKKSREDVIKEFTGIPGIGKAKAEALYDAGYTTKTKLRRAEISELIKVKGISKESAKKLKEALER